MPPTTLKVPLELKQRIAAVVARSGDSAHAFMLKAIEYQTQLAEQRQSFVADALDAREDFQRTASGFDANEVHAHLRARIGGKRTAAPKAKRWRR